jgi:hypothetical protein
MRGPAHVSHKLLEGSLLFVLRRPGSRGSANPKLCGSVAAGGDGMLVVGSKQLGRGTTARFEASTPHSRFNDRCALSNRTQAQHDASGVACIFPHERVDKKGEKPLPAESGEDRLVRPHGAEIGDVLVSEGRRCWRL